MKAQVIDTTRIESAAGAATFGWSRGSSSVARGLLAQARGVEIVAVLATRLALALLPALAIVTAAALAAGSPDLERDEAVNDLIALVGAVDGILKVQSEADADYFLAHANRGFTPQEEARLRDGLLKAYRWQYIVSGVQDPRFTGILADLVNDRQMTRITTALAPLM